MECHNFLRWNEIAIHSVSSQDKENAEIAAAFEEFVSYSDVFDFYFPTSDQHTDGVIKEINGLSINKSHYNEYQHWYDFMTTVIQSQIHKHEQTICN